MFVEFDKVFHPTLKQIEEDKNRNKITIRLAIKGPIYEVSLVENSEEYCRINDILKGQIDE